MNSDIPAFSLNVYDVLEKNLHPAIYVVDLDHKVIIGIS